MSATDKIASLGDLGDSLRIAVVHEWLVEYAGSERVVEQILKIFPAADLFAVVDFLPAEARKMLGDRDVTTTFIQNMPFARRKYRSYLPLMPLAVEQLDLSAYDIVISSSHAVAKGVITGPDQLHISYVHTPMRYAWDLQHQYLKDSGLDRGVRGWLARWLLHRLRAWDYLSAQRVDRFVANSEFIRRRIDKVYRRDAEVIYPPVAVSDFPLREDKEDFYVTASRLVPYKKVATIVEAFRSLPNRRLVVIGDGPEMNRVRQFAGANVTFLGRIETTELRNHIQRARAFLFAAEEDFGITPVEAQLCGTPVIAFARGGALETIRGLEDSSPTGVFFSAQTAQGIADAVNRFEQAENQIHSSACRQNALRFSDDRFRSQFESFVTSAWWAFANKRRNHESKDESEGGRLPQHRPARII